MLDFIALA